VGRQPACGSAKIAQAAVGELFPPISFDGWIDSDLASLIPEIKASAALNAMKSGGHHLAQEIRSLVSRSQIFFQKFRDPQHRI
jgi:hypothetical protein